MARGRKKSVVLPFTKGETWAIVTEDGATIRESVWGGSATLALTQSLARKEKEGTTLYVEHRHLVGPAVRTRRVEHGEGGIVRTTKLSDTI